MDVLIFTGITAIFIIIIFLAVHFVSKGIYDLLKSYLDKRIDPEHYLPEEEIKNQRQLSYLVIILLCIINLFYILECHGFLDAILSFIGISFNLTDVLYSQDANFIFFEMMDIILSAYLSLNLDLKKNRDKVLFLLLVPFGCMETFISILLASTANSLAIFLDVFHMVGIAYFIRFYYRKFMDYSRNHAFGRTVLLFFVLLIFTVILIIITEQVNILDALNMFSNAFVSNGFDVMGTSALGKINEMLIIWGGYILSGVATATLTAAIIVRHFNYKFKEYDDMNKRFDELEEIIKNKKEKR